MPGDVLVLPTLLAIDSNRDEITLRRKIQAGLSRAVTDEYDILTLSDM